MFLQSIRSRNASGRFTNASYADYVDFRDKTRSFDGLLAYDLVPAGYSKSAVAQPQLKMGYLVSGNFFRILGVEPQLGRSFRPDEDQSGAPVMVAVLAYDFWKNELAADPSIVQRQIRFNGIDFAVAGVLPESFTGIDHLFRPAFYIPAAAGPRLTSTKDLLTNRAIREFSIKGRLKSGISIQAADADIAAIAQSLEEFNPSTNRSFGAAVRTERQLRLELDAGDQPLIILLSTLVIIVLAIACANVANLMLNRRLSRAREIAVRWRSARAVRASSRN